MGRVYIIICPYILFSRCTFFTLNLIHLDSIVIPRRIKMIYAKYDFTQPYTVSRIGGSLRQSGNQWGQLGCFGCMDLFLTMSIKLRRARPWETMNVVLWVW